MRRYEDEWPWQQGDPAYDPLYFWSLCVAIGAISAFIVLALR